VLFTGVTTQGDCKGWCCCCKGDRCRGSSHGVIGPGPPVFWRAVFMHRWTCFAACFALRPPRNALDTSSDSSCRTLAKSCCSRACSGCLVASDLTLQAGCCSALLCRLLVTSAAGAKFSLASWAVPAAKTLKSCALTSNAFCCSARLCCMLGSALSSAPKHCPAVRVASAGACSRPEDQAGVPKVGGALQSHWSQERHQNLLHVLLQLLVPLLLLVLLLLLQRRYRAPGSRALAHMDIVLEKVHQPIYWHMKYAQALVSMSCVGLFGCKHPVLSAGIQHQASNRSACWTPLNHQTLEIEPQACLSHAASPCDCIKV
jgi:hypothetical protein